MRLFVGIPLASEVLKELSEAVARLKTPNDGLRWPTPESWHITLQFLGNTDQQHFECVVKRLAEVHAGPVRIRLGELGFFDRAGVFFADVVPSSELVALARQVTTATGGCGFVAEARPYHPHITLARAKGEGRGRTFRALQERIGRERAVPPFRDETAEGRRTRESVALRRGFTGSTATEFLLYESHTRPEGAEYVVRGRFPLDSGSREPDH